MVNRIFKAIAEISHRSSDFETYCSGLQQSGNWGGPTADEAKRDYLILMSFRNNTLVS